MKTLFILTLASLSLSTYASTCLDLLNLNKSDYMGLNDLETIPGATVSDSSGPLFSESLMATAEVVSLIGEFDADSCEDALSAKSVTLENSGSLEFIYTVEDHCDGGNSYGYVIDEAQKVVGVITDSDITCLID